MSSLLDFFAQRSISGFFELRCAIGTARNGNENVLTSWRLTAWRGLFEYKFGVGDGAVMSRVKLELTPETEAVKVVVTNDGWEEDDPAYGQNADGLPRILSRLKTLLETGKTFRPH